MSEFHDILRAVQAEVWEAGPETSATLRAMMVWLADAPLPRGVVRLPTAEMAPGRHLAAQPEPFAVFEDHIVPFVRPVHGNGAAPWPVLDRA